MKTRSERNAEFIAQIDNVSMSVLRVACYVQANRLPELNDMKVVIQAIKVIYEESNDSWVVDAIHNEYDSIKDMSENNIQVWANYRRSKNEDAPIAMANGEFIETKAECIKVIIDGIRIAINDCDFVNIEATSSDGELNWTNVSFATMKKMIQIKSHWDEIKRLVE